MTFQTFKNKQTGEEVEAIFEKCKANSFAWGYKWHLRERKSIESPYAARHLFKTKREFNQKWIEVKNDKAK